MKDAIMSHMEQYESIKDPTPKQMVEFLNKNKHYMVCGDEKKNYMIVSFERGIAYKELFNNLFLKDLLIDKETFVDINAISYSSENNTPETVLDYMIRQANDPTRDAASKIEINRLISVFTRAFGAKTYDELSEAEKQ